LNFTSKESQFTYLYNKIIQTILVSMDNITNEKLRSLFKPITITQSHQKTCGKDGDHPQGAFIKLGGTRSPLSLLTKTHKTSTPIKFPVLHVALKYFG
jgi:hypothetical protein